MKEFHFEIDGVQRGSTKSRIITGKATAGGLLSAIRGAARWFGDVVIEKAETKLRNLPVGGIVVRSLKNSGSWHFQLAIRRVR